MTTKKKLWLAIVLSAVLSALVAVVATWFAMGGLSAFAPPVNALIPQDPAQYGEAELGAIQASEKFWSAMEHADEAGMREIADEECTFVHIGMTCGLDEEIEFYTSGTFRPTRIEFHGRSVKVFGDTAIVITDCNYGLLIGGTSTEHHFAVTEVYGNTGEMWQLIQFSFTALVS